MMKVGCQNKTAKSLWPFLLRHGVRNICSSAPAGPRGYWEPDTLRSLREDAGAAGISVDALMHGGLYQCVETGDVRRCAIERVEGAIRAAGEADFRCILYAIPIYAVPFSTGSARSGRALPGMESGTGANPAREDPQERPVHR